ncbi:sensor histidine kinase [Ruminiclostridium herbifermentans]|uniref:histidine kinase n=1 Tax=Ruminiclostridium herbifermentans TaxID=2488810 RepID=A0A4U7JHG0_9FIRM|nr:histidine kinase [Ruminiclostridium herbifermentans]QNU66124.1 sensor histidine kinase [Ruminiclostridium herbifermentans]
MKKIHILKWLNNVNIRNKLLFSYILVVLLPVLLIGFVLTFSMMDMATERAMYEASNSVDRVYGRLDETLKLAKDLFGQFNMDSNLERTVMTRYQTVNEVLEAYSGYTGIINCTRYYSREIEDIKLYTYNETMLDSGQFIVVDDDIYGETWFEEARTLNRGGYWQMLYNPNRNSSYLSLTTQLNGVIHLKPLGILVISIKESCLTSIVEDESYDTIILDDKGIVLASKKVEFVNKELDIENLKTLSDISSGIHDIIYGDKKVKAIVKTFIPSANNKEFRIVSLVPLGAITDKVMRTFMLGFIIMMISFVMAAVLFIFFANTISKRVKRISEDMHTVALGNFDFLPSIEGNDEIGQLSRDLGVMVKSINDLISEVYVVNMQKDQLAIRQREIKLKMLASQINPHFLFNALEAIRMRAYCNGDEEVAEVIMLLGKIMRRNLEIGNELVFFHEEVNLVKAYLDIQKFRYRNRFNYKLNYSCELENYKLLPLIIQPIVENAVVHGLKWVEEGGDISLNAEKESGILRIIVEDNGCGMDEEQMRNVIESLNEAENDPGQHIGLKNVHQRIRLYYGEDYGISIESTFGKGTRVEITLPWGG